MFCGGDGFRQAAQSPSTGGRWHVPFGVEEKPLLVALWEGECDGKILGTYDEVVAQLEAGTLQLGKIDLVVWTPPCQDYTNVNDKRAGEQGPTGKFFADTPKFIRLLRRAHRVTAWAIEEVWEVTATRTFADIVETLRLTNHHVAYGEVQFWLAGIPTTRARLGLVAMHAPDMRHPGPFELPGLVADATAAAPPMPTLAPYLDPPEAIDAALREDRALMDELGDGHVQNALPAVQVGRMRGPGTNRFVYSTSAPALTLRANIKKAEGLGGVTGLYLDAIGPRRLSMAEVLRLHGFPAEWAATLPPWLCYHIAGNAVPAQWAAQVGRARPKCYSRTRGAGGEGVSLRQHLVRRRHTHEHVTAPRPCSPPHVT